MLEMVIELGEVVVVLEMVVELGEVVVVFEMVVGVTPLLLCRVVVILYPKIFIFNSAKIPTRKEKGVYFYTQCNRFFVCSLRDLSLMGQGSKACTTFLRIVKQE